MDKKIATIILFLISIVIFPSPLKGQDVSQMERMRQLLEKEKALREKIEKEEEEPEIQEGVFIKRIKVKGARLLTKEEIKKISSSYENQLLNLNQIQQISQKILDAYQEKGYRFSSTYRPHLKIKKDTLIIRLKEKYLIHKNE